MFLSFVFQFPNFSFFRYSSEVEVSDFVSEFVCALKNRQLGPEGVVLNDRLPPPIIPIDGNLKLSPRKEAVKLTKNSFN